MLERYNCGDGTTPFIKSDDGYWVKREESENIVDEYLRERKGLRSDILFLTKELEEANEIRNELSSDYARLKGSFMEMHEMYREKIGLVLEVNDLVDQAQADLNASFVIIKGLGNELCEAKERAKIMINVAAITTGVVVFFCILCLEKSFGWLH